MEQLPPLGKAIADIIRPTQQIYEPILQQNAAKIKSTTRKTFKYGNDPRQNLDIYYPSQNPSGDGCPVLIFLYGGGFIQGAKIIPAIADGLVYANLGHFFAENAGFIVVIPDYRVVPQAHFPSGGEDVAMAIQWLQANSKELGASGPQRELYIMGNSAGGVHMSTYLLAPTFQESRKRVLGQAGENNLRLSRAVLLSVPVHFEVAEPERNEPLKMYYGDRVKEDCPLGLLKSVKAQSSVRDLLPGVEFLSLLGSLDPDNDILIPNKDFEEAWNASGSRSEAKLQVVTMNGHNHISPPYALSSGIEKEEEWGHIVVRFCKTSTN